MPVQLNRSGDRGNFVLFMTFKIMFSGESITFLDFKRYYKALLSRQNGTGIKTDT